MSSERQHDPPEGDVADKEKRQSQGLPSSPEEFESALQECKKLVEARILQWRVSLVSGITARLNEQAFEKLQPDSAKRAAFAQVLAQELAPMLDGLAFNAGDEGRALVSLRVAVEGEDLAKERLQELLSRVTRVKDVLFTKSLQDRFAVRRTSKGAVLESIRWDISLKKHDLTVGKVDLPFATIEISLVPDSVDVPLGQAQRTMRNMFSPPLRQVITFDCHLEDIEEILRDLQKLRDSLEKVETGETTK